MLFLRRVASVEVDVWSALMRHRGLLFAGALLVLPVILLYAQTRSPAARGPVVGVIVDAAGGIERAMLFATGGISDFLDTYVMAIGNAEELARLRQNAARTQVLQAEIRELEAANEQLRALASVAATIDGPRPVGARVIGRSGAPLARVARIDRGRRDGVRRGDGVISSGGVVGRVLDAGFTTSDVLLATDPASAIDVVVQRTRARGIVRGKGETRAYRAEVQDFDRLAEIRPDDVLVTSGLDPALPAGLYVGRLTAVARDEDGLYQRAQVEPGANLAAVERVQVLIQRKRSRRPLLAAEAPPDESPDGALLLAPKAKPGTDDTAAVEAKKLPPKLVPKRGTIPVTAPVQPPKGQRSPSQGPVGAPKANAVPSSPNPKPASAKPVAPQAKPAVPKTDAATLGAKKPAPGVLNGGQKPAVTP